MNLYKNSVQFSKKKKYLKIKENGIFSDICINIDNYSFDHIQKFELYSIACKSHQNILEDSSIYFNKEVCKMGF